MQLSRCTMQQQSNTSLVLNPTQQAITATTKQWEDLYTTHVPDLNQLPTRNAEAECPVEVVPIDYEERITLRTLDIKRMEQVDSSVSYKYNLARAMHGLDSVYIIDASGCVVPYKEDATINEIDKHLRHYNKHANGHLDGATGSRKKCKYIGTTGTAPDLNGKGIIESYLDNAKRISHGSILFTECRSMYRLQGLRYVVKPDNDLQLGDCHGAIRYSLYNRILNHHRDVLKQSEYIHQFQGEDFQVFRNEYHALQFRFGVYLQWVAKGVIMPYPDTYFSPDVDLILPDSCFKGRCPSLYEVQTHDAVFGIVNVSNPGKYRTSHQVIHCFNSKPAQKKILELGKAAMLDLMRRRANPLKLIQKALDSLDYASADGKSSDKGEVKNLMNIEKILEADIYGQLHKHPVIVQTCNKYFAKMCKEIATGKFIDATGLMACPMDSLRPEYVISSELKTGTYLLWRYPVRHYGDIKRVKVVNPFDNIDVNGNEVNIDNHLRKAIKGGLKGLDHFSKFKLERPLNGTFYINPEYFLLIGGDFDGDMAVFMPTNLVPELEAEAKSWTPLEDIQKPPKVASTDALTRIAAKSSSNKIGLLAYMMSAFRTFGWVDKMAYLGEQIQLEVDAFKSDTPVDTEWLRSQSFCVNECLKTATDDKGNEHWLKFYKNQDLYLNPSKVLYPTSEQLPDDVVGQLFTQTNDLYLNGNDEDDYQSGISEGESPFMAYPLTRFRTLFDDIQVPYSFANRAREVIKEIRSQYYAVSQAAQKIEDVELRYEYRKAEYQRIRDEWDAWADNLRQTKPEHITTIAAAFWDAYHFSENHNSKTASRAVFDMFSDEIKTQLSTMQSQSFRLWKNCTQYPSDVDWHNNDITYLAYIAEVNNQPHLFATTDYGSDNPTYQCLGAIITDNVTRGNTLPLACMHFACTVQSMLSANGNVSYHQVFAF